MKTNYEQLFNLYAQNAPAHKKLKRDIANIGAVNKTDSDELSCTLRLLKLAIFATQGRMKYYYRYFKADVRGKALELVNTMVNEWANADNSVNLNIRLLTAQQIGAYMSLLTCAYNRDGAVD